MSQIIDGVRKVHGKRGRRMRALERLQTRIAEMEHHLQLQRGYAKGYKGVAKDNANLKADQLEKETNKKKLEAETLKSRI